MAKTKVHELAKELSVQSKDIISFLSGKGVEAKAAQSSVEDDVAAMVRKNFAKDNDTKKGVQAVVENKAEQAVKPAGAEKVTEKPVEKKEAVSAEGENRGEAPKKKKKIIFVSNPQNSRTPGQGGGQANRQSNYSSQSGYSTPGGYNGSGSTYGNRQQQGQPKRSAQGAPANKPMERRPIKPLTPPSPTPTVQMMPAHPQPVKARPVQEKPVQAEAANEQTQNVVPQNVAEQNAAVQSTAVHTPAENVQPKAVQALAENAAEVRGESRAEQPRAAQNHGASDNRNGDNRNRDNRRPDNRGEGRPRDGQGNRPYGDRPYGERREYNGERREGGYNQNRGPQGGQGNRPYGDRPYGERREGGYGQNRGPQGGQGNRPYGDRPYGERREGGYGQNRGPQGEHRGPGRGFGGQGGFNRDGGFSKDGGFNKDGGYNKDGGFGGRGGQGGRGFAKSDNKGFGGETPTKDIEKKREEEKRRFSQEKDKNKKRKDMMFDEEEQAQKNKPGRFIRPEKKKEEAVEEVIKVITIDETITIKDLAEKMRMQPAVIIKKLFMQGKIVTVNQEISFEDAENIAMEYEILCEREVKVDVIEELLKEDEESEDELVERPPVVCVMGHVDHGKTSLLDAIRKTNVTDREAGGITQHIGAYTVTIGGRKITFLDTPGHEAFTAMRMRGANSTDIAILVVAADDGVMPQTIEAINHAKAAGVEIIVAVNKIDKPAANIERVKQELTEYELISEDWGGSTVFAPVSAKTGEGVEQLLEMILLTSDILELKANPKRTARGLVIEAQLDKGRGPVSTVLIQKGTLHVGDFVSAGACYGKVRAMIDDKGRRVKEAGPSTPVEILGLSDVPSAGEVILAHDSDKTAKSYAETYMAQNKEKMLEETKARMSLDDLFSQIQEGNLKELNLIVKADVQGSVEAVKQSLMKLSNDEVVVKCIHGGVGNINESDVMLAMASSAIIIGFNVRPDVTAKATAEQEGVDVRLYKVIYQAIEDIEAAMKGMLDPVFEEKVIGHAEVRQIFKASAIGNIAGSYVLDGTFQRNCKVRISREGKQIYEGSLASLKRFKDDVKEVRAGFECGLVFDGFDQMQELDIVEAYIMVEVPR